MKYELMLKSRGKSALSPLLGKTCGECHLSLRPQLINEVKLQKDIACCEYCSRILYPVDED